VARWAMLARVDAGGLSECDLRMRPDRTAMRNLIAGRFLANPDSHYGAATVKRSHGSCRVIDRARYARSLVSTSHRHARRCWGNTMYAETRSVAVNCCGDAGAETGCCLFKMATSKLLGAVG
jgi:hypothetical protein